jgi:hypothetical protein
MRAHRDSPAPGGLGHGEDVREIGRAAAIQGSAFHGEIDLHGRREVHERISGVLHVQCWR